MKVLGIDPGLTGALFLVDFEKRCGSFCDMPTRLTRSGKTFIDHDALSDVVKSMGAPDHAVVEAVSSSPQMGVVSAFNFGQSLASVRQALASEGIAYAFVAPSLWTKALGVVGKKREGANARARADELMPWLSKHWPLKKHDGRIDAALLAYYGSKG